MVRSCFVGAAGSGSNVVTWLSSVLAVNVHGLSIISTNRLHRVQDLMSFVTH